MADRVTQSIFAAIDSGSYKVAKSLCGQQLKKFPNSSYFYALDSYILILSDQKDEALKHARQLASKTPSDPNALELLNIVFRRAGLYKEAIQVYENACKKYPNRELVQSWFELGIKNFDVLTLQKSSMLLVKQTSDAQEVRIAKFSSAFNLWLASVSAKISDQQRMLFPKLGLKLVQDLQPFTNAQEMFVVANLLNANGKFRETVACLKPFLATEKDLELQILLIRTLSDNGQWSELYDAAHELLFVDKFDDWNTWTALIDAASHLDGKLEVVRDELRDLAPATRNTTLAMLELCTKSKTFDALQAIEIYLQKYASKACCFADLVKFVDLVPRDELLSLLDRALSLQEGHGELSMPEVIKITNYLRFQARLKPELILSESFTGLNLKYYDASKHLLKTKEKTDYFIANELVLLVCQAMLAQSGPDHTLAILKCIAVLERAVQTDLHEFHLRLWLIRLYLQLNCFTRAKAHYESLKIRFVQNDTLSHFLIADIGTLFPSTEASKEIEKAQSVYNNNARETTYLIREAYDKSTYNKIKGFIEFGSRLKNSAARYLNNLELVRLARIDSNKVLLEKALETLVNAYDLTDPRSMEGGDLDERLSDNRDFKTVWEFGGFQRDETVHRMLFGRVKNASYLRCFIARELLVARDESRGSLKQLIEEIESSSRDAELSESEKWSLEAVVALVRLITEKKGDLGDKLGATPFEKKLDSLDKTTYGHLFTVVELCKVLSTVKINYKDDIDTALNKKLTIAIKTMMESLKQDIKTVKSGHRPALHQYKAQLKASIGTELESSFLLADDRFIDGVFEDIESGTLQAIKSLQKFG